MCMFTRDIVSLSAGCSVGKGANSEHSSSSSSDILSPALFFSAFLIFFNNSSLEIDLLFGFFLRVLSNLMSIKGISRSDSEFDTYSVRNSSSLARD